MTNVLRPEDWAPVGIKELEPKAWDVVQSDKHCSVIAGPGAGKTELLAQRANYLLRTDLCCEPRRILAISFKRDAARNLKDRVAQRLNIDQIHRFDSFTFDAFAKNLLDRFVLALPIALRPTADYTILFPNYYTFPDFLNRMPAPPPNIGSMAELQAVSRDNFEKFHVLGTPLSPEGIIVRDTASWAARRWWDNGLRSRPRSSITFPMIGRLVELLLRENFQIRAALQVTYSHVFMDEFQDTTHVQYDLVKTAFLGSDVVMTAVGDNKQRIMHWAMALDDAFNDDLFS